MDFDEARDLHFDGDLGARCAVAMVARLSDAGLCDGLGGSDPFGGSGALGPQVYLGICFPGPSGSVYTLSEWSSFPSSGYYLRHGDSGSVRDLARGAQKIPHRRRALATRPFLNQPDWQELIHVQNQWR
jgi:hypothetical protein